MTNNVTIDIDKEVVKICNYSCKYRDDYRSREPAVYFPAESDECDSRAGKRNEYHDI